MADFFDGLLGALAPAEAEAATYPKLKANFLKMKDPKGRRQLEKDGLLKNGNLYVGEPEPPVDYLTMRRTPDVKTSNTYMGWHAADKRGRTGEMTEEEVIDNLIEMLDNNDTRVIAGFPSRQGKNTDGMYARINSKGEPIVTPYQADEDGDIIIKTLFKPDFEKRKYVMDALGRPLSPMSEIKQGENAMHRAQQPGLSAVSAPSGVTMPEGSTVGKKILPWVVAPAATMYPESSYGIPEEEGLEEAIAPWDLIGGGVLGALMNTFDILHSTPETREVMDFYDKYTPE